MCFTRGIARGVYVSYFDKGKGRAPSQTLEALGTQIRKGKFNFQKIKFKKSLGFPICVRGHRVCGWIRSGLGALGATLDVSVA